MIQPTEKDIGREVFVAKFPHLKGKLVSLEPCGAPGCECCKVQYRENERPWSTSLGNLEWADKDLPKAETATK